MIRNPAAITLRSLEKYPWGLRAKLAFVFALQDFEDLGQIDFERYRVFTFVPGIEALIPVGELLPSGRISIWGVVGSAGVGSDWIPHPLVGGGPTRR